MVSFIKGQVYATVHVSLSQIFPEQYTTSRFPFHANNKFFAMNKIPHSTFAAFDVMKNPKIERDHERFKAHLAKLFEDLPSKATKNWFLTDGRFINLQIY